jgi:isomerase DpgB
LSAISVPTASPSDADFTYRLDPAAALSPAVIGGLDGLAARAEDAGPGAVVLRLSGAPGATGEWPGEIGIHQVNHWERALRRIERLPAVTIAVAVGSCGGAALDLLLSCDYRIAGAGAVFEPPVVDGQLWPGMAIHRLTTQLGVRRARRLVMFPGRLSATDAADLGLIDEIADDPDAAAAARVAATAAGAGGEAAIRRRLLLDAAATSFEEALGAHLAACDRALRRSAEAV